jgi:hypothetical protein
MIRNKIYYYARILSMEYVSQLKVISNKAISDYLDVVTLVII